jgi:hypothetical protein
MATLTTNRPGANADYSTYLYGVTRKTDNINKPNLLDFALHDYDGNMIMPDRGTYIRFTTETYGVWYTGFLTNGGNPVFLGSKLNDYSDLVPKWAYTYEATSDEYILNLHPLGIVPPFVNQTQGQILKQLIAILAPDNFPVDVTGIQDGQIIPRYVVDPTQHFSDVIADFTSTAVYRFYMLDMKAYFMPQDEQPAGIVVDASDTHFTPSKLQVSATNDSIINDAIVIGKIEPQNRMVEYFVSDGATAEFPLISTVFGVDSAVLLDEQFSGASIDTAKWSIYDPTGQTIIPSNGYLNAIGGGGDADPTYIQSANLIPLEGTLRITHGEFDFVNFSLGAIGALWTGNPGPDVSKIFYGIQLDPHDAQENLFVRPSSGNATKQYIRPYVFGTPDLSQWAPISFSKRYVIRTVYQFNSTVRRSGAYTSVTQDGQVSSVTLPHPDDSCFIQTLVTEIDPVTAAVTGQWNFYNTVSTQATEAVYTPFLCIDVHAAVTGVTVSTPMQVSLEEKAPLGVVPTFAGVGGTLSSSPSALTPGDKTVTISWTTVASTSVALRHSSPDGPVVTGVTQNPPNFQFRADNLPGNGSLQIVGNLAVPGTQLYLTDNFTQAMLATITLTGTEGSPWTPKLVGPNEVDSRDGMAPVATVIDSNNGALTRQSLLGTANYNPGQAKLTYFKNTAQYQSFIPPKGTLIKVTYNRAGAAIGRVQDRVSITNEAFLWGDDGVRSDTRNNLQPAPRSSMECEIAAAALIQGSSYQHYTGTFTMPSGPWFTSEPVSATILNFKNLDLYPQFPQSLMAEGITQVATTFDHSRDDEYFTHTMNFGPIDPFTKVLSKFRRLDEVFTPQDTAEIPGSVELGSLGTSYIGDADPVYLDFWDANNYYFTIGKPLLRNGGFETTALNFWNPSNPSLAVVEIGGAHTGICSARLTGAGTNISQRINGLTPGAVYTFGVWVSARSGTPTASAATMSVNDSTGALLATKTLPSPGGSTQFVLYTLQFTVGPVGNAIVTLASLTNSFTYFDDAVLTNNPNDLLFREGGYELRLSDDGWGAYNGKNLLNRISSREFFVPRYTRNRVFFVKAYDIRNYILHSEDFSFWGASLNNPTILNKRSRKPDGDLGVISQVTASAASFTTVGQIVSQIPKAGDWYTFSLWVKGTPGETVSIDMYTTDNVSVVLSPPITLAPGWNHLSISNHFLTNQAAPLSCNIVLNPLQVVQLSQAQLERNAQFTYYARTDTAPYGVLSRYSQGVHVGLPLAPKAPTATINGADPANPVVTLSLPAAISDVAGVEIRASDNRTILIHYDLTDPNYLQIPAVPSTTYQPNYSQPFYTIRGNTQSHVTYYCYTYNVIGDYSPAFLVEANV